MADNVVLPGIDTTVAADDCGGVLVQRVKVVGGADGVLGPGLAVDADGAIPVTLPAGPLSVVVQGTVAVTLPADPLPVSLPPGPVSVAVEGVVPVSLPEDPLPVAVEGPVAVTLPPEPLTVVSEQLDGCRSQGQGDSGENRSLYDLLDPFCPNNVPLRVAPADISSPGQRDAASSFPVALADEHIRDKSLFAAWAPGAYTVGKNVLQPDGAWTEVSQYRSISVQTRCDGASTVTLLFEGSNDGISPCPLWLFDAANVLVFPVTTVAPTASTTRFWMGALPFRFVRFRVSVALATAGLSVYTRLSMAPFAVSTPSANIQIAGANASNAGATGALAVGGYGAIGNVPGVNPIVTGGVDVNNLVRREMTDVMGNRIAVGPDARQFPATLNPVPVASQRWDLLFSQILNELRTLNFAVALMANGQPVPETLSDDLMQSSDSATVTQ